ncbi:adenosylcobinamide-phosphate synthase CbiB [Mesorhizobium sp. BAC0120]|uniref:adenosylcobinamide-phosphate synthase CbiB n=1 Tax=Mesorhizobium sp. BAC0120 TaxID=3090670 RepID=UPI00298C1662|nr:adenosylcobinamide-phosphate synthase CbiB [Mesorhizobium sp. BAC0120]MDW6020538.1 adenosylcobinamide-phosphate synthase CbiB [Mesorhizobium sp. BAC0120]
MAFPLAFLSLLLELAFGYPDRLFKAIGHPVTWIGSLISLLDRRLNSQFDSPRLRQTMGMLALAILLVAAIVPALLIESIFSLIPFGIIATAIPASSLLAQKSLAEHVGRVATGLETGGLAQGRKAVSMIVGRDPERLDEAGVSRAAIESLAENFSDGVVAPAFWLAIGGLAGGVAYKAVNTADSMIGHKTPRHQAFGWAAARLDDLINLPASRLAALLIIAAAFIVPGASPGRAWKSVLRDASKHRSPNAGWPEAAMAGALGLSLAGPRYYGGVLVGDAEMGAGGRRAATAADIRRALKLYHAADLLLGAVIGIVAAAVILQGQ